MNFQRELPEVEFIEEATEQMGDTKQCMKVKELKIRELKLVFIH